MNLKKIDDKTFYDIKDAMTQKMQQTMERCNLTEEERDLLVEINSRTLYGLNVLCERHGVPFDYESKLDMFDCYDFGYKQSSEIRNVCAENHRGGFNGEDAKNGKVVKNTDEILLLYPENMSEQEIKNLLLNKSEMQAALIQMLVHENLHFMDGFSEDNELFTTRFKHAKLDNVDTNYIVEISTEYLSCEIINEFFDENYLESIPNKDIRRSFLTEIDGVEKEVQIIKPKIGTGYGPISSDMEMFKIGGLNGVLNSYVNLTDDIFVQFDNYSQISDYDLSKRLAINMDRTLSSFKLDIPTEEGQKKFKEELISCYMEENQLRKDMFEAFINRREENAKVEYEKILLEKNEVLTTQDIEHKKDEFINFSRKNSFDDYIQKSINLIDSSFLIHYDYKDVRPLEQLMGDLDIKLYGQNFKIENEDDKLKLIEAFQDIRDIKREHPEKEVNFDDIVKICEEKGILIDEDNEKVLVEPQLEALYEHQKQLNKEMELNL